MLVARHSELGSKTYKNAFRAPNESVGPTNTTFDGACEAVAEGEGAASQAD